MRGSPAHTSCFLKSTRAKEGTPTFAEAIEDMYASAYSERGQHLRIDILMIYDLDQLVPVTEHADNLMAFAFRDSGRKPEALLGILNILGADELVG